MVLFKWATEIREAAVKLIYIPLWSYSNLTLRLIFTVFPYLHSTMVLFKLESDVNNAPFLSIFTFHYGPIQIRLYFLKPFQFFIYIPLWSYSNFATDDTNTNLYEIYIPLWSYSNE